MKTHAPPLSYQPMLMAMRATAFGAAMAQIYPDRQRPTLEQLADLANAHQARMARAAAELQGPPAAAATRRAAQVRRFETFTRNV